MNKELENAAITVIIDCMGAKTNEKILVISDNQKIHIGLAFWEKALELGFESILVLMKEREINGEEPPEYISELMKLFDIVLAPTTKSLTHTNARRNASSLGVRVATFPGITEDILIRGMSANYNEISNRTLILKDLMLNTEIVTIKTPAGTDLVMNIKARKVIPSNGIFREKGEGGNLPTGEAFVAPIEDSTNGIFVVDGSMAGIGVLENEKIIMKVENGIVTDFSGGSKAKKLEEILSKFDDRARSIAELGIGTNDKAILSGTILEDEKVMGTVHVALGNNITMGGNLDVPIHLDGVMLSPTVYFDDKLIMDNGKLLIQ